MVFFICNMCDIWYGQFQLPPPIYGWSIFCWDAPILPDVTSLKKMISPPQFNSKMNWKYKIQNYTSLKIFAHFYKNLHRFWHICTFIWVHNFESIFISIQIHNFDDNWALIQINILLTPFAHFTNTCKLLIKRQGYPNHKASILKLVTASIRPRNMFLQIQTKQNTNARNTKTNTPTLMHQNRSQI